MHPTSSPSNQISKRPRGSKLYFHPCPLVVHPPPPFDVSSSQTPSQSNDSPHFTIPTNSKPKSTQITSSSVQYVDVAATILVVATQTTLTTFQIPNQLHPNKSSSSLYQSTSALAQWQAPTDFQIAAIALSPDAKVLAIAIRHHAATNIHPDPPALVLLQPSNCIRLLRIVLPHNTTFQLRPQPPFHHRPLAFISTPRNQDDQICCYENEKHHGDTHTEDKKEGKLIELAPCSAEESLPTHLRTVFLKLKKENHPEYITNINNNDKEQFPRLPLPPNRTSKWTLAVVPATSATTITLYTFHPSYSRVVYRRSLPLPTRAAALTAYPVPLFDAKHTNNSATRELPTITLALTTPRHAQYLHSLRYLIPLPTPPDLPLLRIVAIHSPQNISGHTSNGAEDNLDVEICAAIVRRGDTSISWAVSAGDSLTLTNTHIAATDVIQWTFPYDSTNIYGVALARDARIRFFGSLFVSANSRSSPQCPFFVKTEISSRTQRLGETTINAAIASAMTADGVVVVSTSGSCALVRFSPVEINSETKDKQTNNLIK